MAKSCQQCEYVAEDLLDQQEPPGVPENCPQCGGIGTVVDEPESGHASEDEE